MEQADADVQPALHASRELLGQIILAIDEPDHLEHLVDSFVDRSSPDMS